MGLELNMAQGTIKHAYDTLERLGLIQKTRGSGTFVKKGDPEGTKALAMKAVDGFLDRMQSLGFQADEIRIFLDLKLRERAGEEMNVVVAACDCNPESLQSMCEQILRLPNTEVTKYLLDDVLRRGEPFDPEADVIVTTASHFDDLSRVSRRKPERLVMAAAADTVVQLAALPEDTRLGVVTASQRFRAIILDACKQYCRLKRPVETALFGEAERVAALAASCACLVLPARYATFASKAGMEAVKAAAARGCRIIEYHYQAERGSLLYLEETVQRLWQKKQANPASLS